MADEKEILRKLSEYEELAKENPKVDVAALMSSALMAPTNTVRPGWKRFSYFISITAPPLGLIPAVFYFFGGKSDGKRTAINCIILTLISALGSWFLLKSLISNVPSEQLDQIQQIKPDEIRSLLQN